MVLAGLALAWLWPAGAEAKDIRVDQQQVNAARERVGINRPDLQYTIGNQRYYVEFDRATSARGYDHARRLFANDPAAVIILNPIG